ncbi:YggS family pyridoxal phosphate-dependent enzyme [Alicyclobacillus kakegawensis]|uniref:YggS family pyridoxal phosphate-dependent enzyme n=1 Tax=Alicyclobacillus kakegawensis TaxID=392012 RepID=UPI00083231EE|nr:YggS family pyridoxal phosphate-dependent enzyme [Alicyclobacillus kakegawensis]
MTSLPERLAEVRAEIESACVRSGRSSASVRLIAVTKTVAVDVVQRLVDSGLRDFGENRWQQARDKVNTDFGEPVTWHFIGRLQQNKAKYVVPRFSWIHSLDSLSLAAELDKRAQLAGKTMQVLVQVNVSGESSKAGVAADELWPLLEGLADYSHLQVRGLMTMAPDTEDPETSRPVFRRLRQLLEEARTRYRELDLQELSMGMSNDFVVAVEEGATMVRVGRRLVGASDNQE